MTLELKQLIFVVKSALKDIPLDEKKKAQLQNQLYFRLCYKMFTITSNYLSYISHSNMFFFVMGVNGLPFLPHILFVF